jgi:hypothetical protein
VRWLSAALILVFSASVSCVVLWFVWFFVVLIPFGGTECDRAQCPAFGEWAWENNVLILSILAALSLLAGLLLTRRFLAKVT